MRFSFTLAAIAVCLAVSMSAHHSHGQYAETFSDMTGIVKEVHLVQPHSWIYMEVKDDKGEAQLWAGEATGRRHSSRWVGIFYFGPCSLSGGDPICCDTRRAIRWMWRVTGSAAWRPGRRPDR